MIEKRSAPRAISAVEGAIRPQLPSAEFLVGSVAIESHQINDYGRASGDLNPIHFSDIAAVSMGLPGKIVHGLMLVGLVEKMWSEWADQFMLDTKIALRFSGLETKFVGFVLPGDKISVHAKAGPFRDNTITFTFQAIRNDAPEQISISGSVLFSL